MSYYWIKGSLTWLGSWMSKALWQNWSVTNLLATYFKWREERNEWDDSKCAWVCVHERASVYFCAKCVYVDVWEIRVCVLVCKLRVCACVRSPCVCACVQIACVCMRVKKLEEWLSLWKILFRKKTFLFNFFFFISFFQFFSVEKKIPVSLFLAFFNFTVASIFAFYPIAF